MLYVVLRQSFQQAVPSSADLHNPHIEVFFDDNRRSSDNLVGQHIQHLGVLLHGNSVGSSDCGTFV